MNQIEVKVWGGDQKIPINIENDKQVNTDSSGYKKKFLFNRDIVAYSNHDGWAVLVDKVSTSVGDVYGAKVKIWPFLTVLELNCKRKKYRFYDFTPWDYFTIKLDPTFDELDLAGNFSIWLKYQLFPENHNAGNDVLP